VTVIAAGVTAHMAIARLGNATIPGRVATTKLAVRIRRGPPSLRHPSSNDPRTRVRRARMSTSATMPMMTICPPRCRRSVALRLLVISPHGARNSVLATKVNDKNAATIGRRNERLSELPRSSQNASHQRKVTNAPAAVSATPPIALAMRIDPSLRVAKKLNPSSRALRELNHVTTNRVRNVRATNGRALIDRVLIDQSRKLNRKLVRSLAPQKLVRPNRAHRVLPNRDPLNHVLLSAMLHRRANADPTRPLPSQPLLSRRRRNLRNPSVSRRRRRIRRSRRSPVWA
jgi:hypothetical protein